MTSTIIVELSLIITQLQSNKDKRKHGDRIMHCTNKKSLQYSQKFKLIQILTVNVWEKKILMSNNLFQSDRCSWRFNDFTRKRYPAKGFLIKFFEHRFVVRWGAILKMSLNFTTYNKCMEIWNMEVCIKFDQ